MKRILTVSVRTEGLLGKVFCVGAQVWEKRKGVLVGPKVAPEVSRFGGGMSKVRKYVEGPLTEGGWIR